MQIRDSFQAPHKLLGKYVWVNGAVVDGDVPVINVFKIQEIKLQAEYHCRILEVSQAINVSL